MKYWVQLKPHLSNDFKVEGKVEMQIKANLATRKIIFHMNDIITLNDTIKVCNSIWMTLSHWIPSLNQMTQIIALNETIKLFLLYKCQIDIELLLVIQFSY